VQGKAHGAACFVPRRRKMAAGPPYYRRSAQSGGIRDEGLGAALNAAGKIMATRPKRPQSKPQTKKPTTKKVVAAKVSEAAVRAEAAPEPAPAVRAGAAPAPTPVLVNAVTPEEKLPEIAQAAVDSAVDTFEKSLKAALPVARKVNSKLVDIAQANMNSGLELARDLAGAKSPMEMMRLGMSYWHENLGVFENQAQELRMLSAELMTTASEPIRAHIRRA
jgi:hypothetical protein